MVEGKVVVDAGQCTHCGVCVGKCPFGAVPKEAESRCRVFVGGTWGKKTRMGTALSRMVSESEVYELIEKTMLWFKDNAYAKERLGMAIDRVGVDKLEQALFSNELLEHKDEILAAEMKQR